MLLQIKLVNNKTTGWNAFGLFQGSTQMAKNRKVSTGHLLQTLNNARSKTKEMNKATSKAIDEAIADQSDVTVIECLDSHIVSEFGIIKNGTSISLDMNEFFINEDYLPNDEKAPERIHAIASELNECIGEMFQIKNHTLEVENDGHRDGILTTGRTEDDQLILARIINGKKVLFSDNMVEVEEAIKALYFYQVEYARIVQNEWSKPVSTSGKKHLKGLSLSLIDGAVVVHNAKDYSQEVQNVLADMIVHFRLK